MIQNALLGSVQYSVLEPNLFFQINGKDWVLLDGQSIAGSELSKLTGMSSLPDARGNFIRSMNVNREVASGDPDGERSVGSFQLDQFGAHNHGGGNHGHGWQGASTIDTWGGNVVVGGNGIGQKATPPSGVIINTEGGNETRPRNISLYLYIKIN